MKKHFAVLALGLTALTCSPVFAKTPFALTSPDFIPNQAVAQKNMLNTFGCTGGNVSPELNWRGAPAGTKSFVLTMYDPDAPTGSGWWHWVVYNIPASASGLPAGAGAGEGLPTGALQGNNDGSDPHYGGPCPPQGAKAHRYVVTLNAVNVEKLDLPPNASPAFVGFMTGMHRVGQTSFTVKVKR
jgi:Raf kinase inhibitor-like YbhB/YbcL family protein